jgi:quercetin dioxygenase-like cupin family protein
MKLIKTNEFGRMPNPSPGAPFRAEILTAQHQAKELGGIFGLLPPSGEMRHHYHRNRESIIVVLSGETMVIVEGEEFAIRPGDILHIAPGERHGSVNRSDEDFRFFEFFTYPPLASDFVEVA